MLVGTNPTFSCSAYGTADITVTWFRVNPASTSPPTPVEDGVTQSEVGSTEVTVTSTLTLTSGVSVADDGAMFYCIATHNLTNAGVFTNQSDSATLTVQCMLTIDQQSATTCTMN